MQARQAELVVDARDGVGESPVWMAAESALYWVDIPGRAISRWSPDSGAVDSWQTPEMPGCIAPHAAGGWICALESGVQHLVLLSGGACAATPLATVRHARSGMRFNDGRCDRQGRLRAGTMLLDMAAGAPCGEVWALDPSGLHALQQGLIVPNGMAFSPDGRTMYLSDSHPSVQQVWAFDYDIDAGRPGARRTFIDMREYPGRPDGAAVDADGCYWICGNDAGQVHRFTPDGRLDRSLAVPVKKPAMCAFGGSGLDTLFVTSIRPPGDCADQPLAGGVFALQPGVRGLAETPCQFPLTPPRPQETP